MNAQYKYSEAICNCTNQHLLTPGNRCENCGGITPEKAAVPQATSAYDEDFFEALDAWMEMMECAA